MPPCFNDLFHVIDDFYCVVWRDVETDALGYQILRACAPAIVAAG
jgi:hypothetical protein